MKSSICLTVMAITLVMIFFNFISNEYYEIDKKCSSKTLLGISVYYRKKMAILPKSKDEFAVKILSDSNKVDDSKTRKEILMSLHSCYNLDENNLKECFVKNIEKASLLDSCK